MRVLTCLFLLFAARYYPQSFNWTQDFKTTYDTYGRQVLADPQGNAYVICEYDSHPTHGAGFTGSLLRKYDRTGNLQWSIDKPNEYLWKIVFDQTGQLVLFAKEAGITYSAKVDTVNGLLVQKKALFSGGFITSAHYDKSGNLFLSGVYRDSIILGNTTYSGTCCENSFFTAKFNQAGTCIWSIASRGTPYFGWSAIDPFGNTFITGVFFNTLTLGNYTITGDIFYPGFLAKVDTAGKVLWLKRISEPYSPQGHLIATDHLGNVLVGGVFNKPFSLAGTTLTPSGSGDAFVLKLDNSGDPIWLSKLSSSDVVDLKDMHVDQNGEVLLAGAFNSDINFGNHALSSISTFSYNYFGLTEPFFTRFDANGNCRWAMKGGCATDGRAYAANCNLNNGYLYFAGSYNGNVFFGEPTPHQGGDKMYVSQITDPFAVGLIETTRVKTALSAFPNPASDFLTLQGLTEGSTSITIINCLGQSIKTEQVNNSNNQIEITELPIGIYLIRATQGTAAYQFQFIKTN